jgi:RHS repeat-associated protein
MLTDSAGNVIERYSYTAEGEPTIYEANGTTLRTTSSYANQTMFTGRRYDEETLLYYFRGRYYDPEQSNFISRDSSGYHDGMSLYLAYFVPNGIDPTGWIACTVDFKKIEKLRKRLRRLTRQLAHLEVDGSINTPEYRRIRSDIYNNRGQLERQLQKCPGQDICLGRSYSERCAQLPHPTGVWRTVQHPHGNHLRGTIEFVPVGFSIPNFLHTCPRCNKIRLVQAVRTLQPVCGMRGAPLGWRVYNWGDHPHRGIRFRPFTLTDGEEVSYAVRDKNGDIVYETPEEGWFIDHDAGKIAGFGGTLPPSEYYSDYWNDPVFTSDGSLTAAGPRKAMIWDSPNSGNFLMLKFEFETCAKCDDNGLILDCFRWGFTSIGGRNPHIKGAWHNWRTLGPSANMLGALDKFHEFYDE